MRTLNLAAGSLMAALCLTACEATTDPGGGGDEKGTRSTTTIGVAPSQLIFRVHAFGPPGDPATQSLTVNRVGGGSMVWSARTTAGWISLGPAGGSAPGRLQVAVSRASMHLGLNGYRPQYLTGMITVTSAGAATVQVPVSVLISYQTPIKIGPGVPKGPKGGPKFN